MNTRLDKLVEQYDFATYQAKTFLEMEQAKSQLIERLNALEEPLTKTERLVKHIAETRIRTWVAVATTQSLNH